MRIEVDGRSVYAYTGSRTFDATLPTIVFLHGAANDHSVWALQSRYFAHHGHSVLALDLPGHGNSEKPALPSIATLAEWTIAVLDRLAVHTAALIGHSMGALSALELAARYPERTSRVALLGPSVPMPVSDVLLDAAKRDDPIAFDLITGWSFSASHQLGGNPQPGLWMTGGAYRLLERSPAGVLHADLLACQDYTDGLAAARDVRCPVLVIVGNRDLMAPPRNAQALIETLPAPRVVKLDDSGHSLMMEAPDAVLDALREFLGPEGMRAQRDA